MLSLLPGWLEFLRFQYKKKLFVRLHYLALTDDFYTFAVIGETITLASPNGQTFLSNGEW